MGIARRKAGTVVKCPNCNGQVVVPIEEGVEGPESPPPGTQQPLFERSDIDEVLGGKRVPAPPVPEPAAAAPPKGPGAFPPSFQPVPAKPSRPKETAGGALPVPGQQLDFPANLPMPATPPGIVMSPTMATLLSVAVVIALALAFTAGLIVGRLFLQPPSQRDESQRSQPPPLSAATSLPYAR